MTSIGLNERSWARSHAIPQINPYRLSNEAQSPSSYISLLDQYLALLPHLSPAPIPATLSHPDLHLDNIFVDPETMEIKCIIDWQSASVSEPYFQHSYPPMLSPITFTIKNDDREAIALGEDPEVEKFLRRLPNLCSHYQTLKRKNSPKRWDATHHANRHFLTKFMSSITGSWTRDNGFSLCHDLIAVAKDWENTTPMGIPCPLHFTEEDFISHRRDLQVVAELAQILEQLEQASIIPNGGKVLVDDFDRALEASRSVKAWFVGKGESEKERGLNAKVWPYQT